MKIYFYHLIICSLALFIFINITSCKKTAGIGGKNSIYGTITYKNGASNANNLAAASTVSISYGTNEATTTFNSVVLTDVSGNYNFEGLEKGNYFIKASYKDANGFEYSSAGVGITLKNKKNKTEANLNLE